MSEVNYIKLLDLLNLNPHKLEIIKNQYLLLLSKLTSTDLLENDIFITNIEQIHKMGSIIVGIVEDSSSNFEIISSGTIIIEPKIIRGGKNVGHIEDIIVADHMRGQGIAQKMLEMLKTIAKYNNCYKVILDCDNDVKTVYTKNGFEVKGLQMAEYFV
jgi:glucosamine-phosphate N-acetyltransferase